MSEILLCRVVLSAELPAAEVEFLASSIQLTSAKVQKTTSRAFGADDLALLITILVGIGQLAEYGISIAKAINSWRRQARQKGLEPQGKLERPDHPPLDLNTATDEEVEEWLLH
jgi:hypothetical protein